MNVTSLKAVATATTTLSPASAAGKLCQSALPSRPLRRLAAGRRILLLRRRRRHLRGVVGGSSFGRPRSRSPALRKRRRRFHLHDCCRPAPSDSSPAPAESLHSTHEVAIYSSFLNSSVESLPFSVVHHLRVQLRVFVIM